MKPVSPPLAAKLLEELTRGGFVKGASATIDDRWVSMNTTIEADRSKFDAIAAIRRGCPAFPYECSSLLEASLVRPSDIDTWAICLEFETEEAARAVGQFEDLVKGYDRG